MGIQIRNAHLWTDPYEVRTDVYLEGSKIASVGKAPEDFTADEIIDATGKTLMPGLVNCHTHAYMSLFRNYADDLPFHEWLFEKIEPLENRMTPEEAYYGNLLSMAEMIRTGTTCFVDMHMFPHQVVKACAQSGMRAHITRGLVGSDRNDEGGLLRIGQAMEEQKAAADVAGAHVTFGLGPHAIYTCGEDFLRYVLEIAKESGLMLNIHLSETQKEYDDCIAQHGKTPVRYLHDLGLFDVPIILAHCVYLAEEDYTLLNHPNVSVALNPASNMKLANGFADATRMLREGIRLCLGTDGASSNNALNLFQEMRLLSLTQKGVTKEALSMTAEETLSLVIRGGYRAIGQEEKLGAIEKGRTADLILIDENAPNLLPRHNIRAALVYSATGYEVTDSIIHGKIVMRDRNLITIDEERVDFEIQRIIEKWRTLS